MKMIGESWNTLLLSSLFILIPTVADAQTAQGHMYSVCSSNFNESDRNQVTIEGDCSQTTYVTNNIYLSDSQEHNEQENIASGVGGGTGLAQSRGALLIERPPARDLGNPASQGGIRIVRPEPRPLH